MPPSQALPASLGSDGKLLLPPPLPPPPLLLLPPPKPPLPLPLPPPPLDPLVSFPPLDPFVLPGRVLPVPPPAELLLPHPVRRIIAAERSQARTAAPPGAGKEQLSRLAATLRVFPIGPVTARDRIAIGWHIPAHVSG
jgi:hypothetical protein